jgi:hypothetical protein
MKLPLFRRQQTFFVACMLCLMQAAAILSSSHAATLLSLEDPNLKTQVNHVDTSPSPADFNEQLMQMQQKLEMMETGYNQKLQQMQVTIDTLKAQISKNSPTKPAAPDGGDSLAEEAPPGDQDIGEALIFGDDEETSTSSSGSNNTSTTQSTMPSLTSGTVQNASGLLGRVGQLFNPDIFVVGDFTGHYGSRSNLPEANRFSLREAEFGFQSAIDPYARGTFFFAVPDGESLELEEGYATLTALPLGLQARVGKFRSIFGKINRLHAHDLPQTDTPDVITAFFGEEGLVGSGVHLNKLLPTPWFSQFDLEVANTESTPFFGHDRLTKPLLVGHLKNFFNLSDNNSLEVGVSAVAGARGPEDMTRGSGVGGIDITYRHITPSLVKNFTWQTELLGATQEHPFNGKGSLFGGYSFLEYRFKQRWDVGIRFDYTQLPLLASASTWAVAPYINFWQSEFGRLRLEYKHAFGTNAPSSDRLWAQYTMIMGVHPPHPF